MCCSYEEWSEVIIIIISLLLPRFSLNPMKHSVAFFGFIVFGISFFKRQYSCHSLIIAQTQRLIKKGTWEEELKNKRREVQFDTRWNFYKNNLMSQPFCKTFITLMKNSKPYKMLKSTAYILPNLSQFIQRKEKKNYLVILNIVE